MAHLKDYIKSFRLRTLPLSVSGIILGSALAVRVTKFHIWTFVFAIFTTLSLQILSNISNEMGDAQHGTDNPDGTRPTYGLQAGTISAKEMTHLIWLLVGLSVLFGVLLILSAFGTLFSLPACVMLILGLAAIVAAMKYTMGKNPYGYNGLGDLFVLIFFGIVSVCGAYYLQTQTNPMAVMLPALSIGFLSVGVLNINNIRDLNVDKSNGKHTLASKIGRKNAKLYQVMLVTAAVALFFIYGFYWVLIFLPLFIWHFYAIFTESGKQLDKQLPILSVTTLLISILYSIIIFVK